MFWQFSPPLSQKPRKDKKGGKKHRSKQPAEGEGEAEQPPEDAGGELLSLDLAAITVTPQQVGWQARTIAVVYAAKTQSYISYVHMHAVQMEPFLLL